MKLFDQDKHHSDVDNRFSPHHIHIHIDQHRRPTSLRQLATVALYRHVGAAGGKRTHPYVQVHTTKSTAAAHWTRAKM